PRIQPPAQSALLISQGTEGSGRAWQSEGQIVRRWGQGSASRGGAAQREPGRGEQGNQGKPAEAGAKARARRAHQRPTLRYDLEVPHHVRRSLRLPLCASLAPRAPQASRVSRASRVSSGLRRSRSPPRSPPPSPPPPRPTPSSTEPPPAPRRGVLAVRCTGVVVAPHGAATAAHCGPTHPGAFTLGFGNWATLPGGLAATSGSAGPAIVGGFGSLDTGSLGRHAPVAAYHAPAGDVMLLKLAHPAPAPSVKRAGADPAP